MKKQKKNKSNLKIKIISGAWKGRNISFLEKRDLRPTKNQIRETLFNWLQNDVKNSVCIDLFAGSGALGFEAASRGAKQVFMVDNDIDIINSLNSQKIKFEASNVDLIHANAEEYIEGHHDEVDIIFLDPPFSKNIINNIIIAYSFTPEKFSIKYELGVPHINKRLIVLKKLSNLGWKLGIRFDPVVVYEGWKDDYKKLFTQIFKNVDTKNIHSISFGKLRFPESVYKKITKDNPSESLFFNLVKIKNIYESNVNENIEVFCKESLKNFIDEKKIFFNN